MFARRKKPRQEDEPLVPHGLVWQATDGPSAEGPPPPMQPKPRTLAEPIEMPAPAVQGDTQVEGRVDAPVLPINPPSDWPRLKGDEVARRAKTIDTAVSFPYRGSPAPAVPPAPFSIANGSLKARPTPLRSETAPAPEAVPVPQSPKNGRPSFSLPSWPNLKLVYSKDAAAKLESDVRRRFWAMLIRMRMLCLRSWSATTLRWNHARMVVKKRAAVDLKKPVASVRGLSARQNGQWSVTSTQFRAGLAARSRGLRTACAELSATFRQAGGIVQRQSSASVQRLQRLAERCWNHEVRIRIRTRADSRMAAAGSFGSALAGKFRQSFETNERLWTSMLMAGLSAVLALAVISGLREYGPVKASSPAATHSRAASPVNTNSSPQTAPATTQAAPRPATATTAKPSASILPSAAAVEQPAAKPAASSVSVEVQKKKVRRAHHYSPDQDYVAQDTYKYYGPSGKPSSR